MRHQRLRDRIRLRKQPENALQIQFGKLPVISPFQGRAVELVGDQLRLGGQTSVDGEAGFWHGRHGKGMARQTNVRTTIKGVPLRKEALFSDLQNVFRSGDEPALGGCIGSLRP